MLLPDAPLPWLPVCKRSLQSGALALFTVELTAVSSESIYTGCPYRNFCHLLYTFHSFSTLHYGALCMFRGV